MNLLLAFDDSDCSEAALSGLIDQFRPDGAEVRVIHVIEWPHDLPTSVAFAEGPSAAQCLLGAKAERQRQGHELIARAVGRLRRAHFSTTAHLVEGGPRQAIVAMAAEWPADAIVVGSHGRHGLDRVLLGSVSDGVVRHARCSVHVMRVRGATGTATAPPSSLTTVKREGVTS
jgi:nucleotide-binding universal stress UspA family protein